MVKPTKVIKGQLSDAPTDVESNLKAETDDGDDGVTWRHSVSKLKQLQSSIRTPNPNDPGYARQKENGKLWVRERLEALLDSGSFIEVGSITGQPVKQGNDSGETKLIPGNIVTGWGEIEGQRVFVTADDFSVRGGHSDGGVAGKVVHGEVSSTWNTVQCRQTRYPEFVMQIMARKARVPLVRLLDGSSGGGSVAMYLRVGQTYIPPLAGLGEGLDAMAIVPVTSALLGPVVGLAAAKVVISHFSVMVKGLSQLFAAGPPVVKSATFEDLSKEALGGWEIHAQNGTVDNVATSEHDAFHQIRKFLSYLPSSVFSLAHVKTCNDPSTRREEGLISIIPRRRTRAYDIRKLIHWVVDVEADPLSDGTSVSSFFEIGRTWAGTIVTGFARLQGRSVGILSSDCTINGGAIDALGSQKTARFVKLCDQFNIPILNLVDQPGFAVGSAAEVQATLRHGAAAIAALYEASIPIFTVIVRRVFGVAGGAFADLRNGQNFRVAWPSGDWGSLPLEGGIEAAYKRQLNNAPTPEAREQLMSELLAKFEEVRSPMKTAHSFGIEEIIDPRDTRPLACTWISHVYEHVLPQRQAVKQMEVVARKSMHKL